MGRTVTVEVPGRPVSLNSERTRHWAQRAEQMAQVRRDARIVTFEALGPYTPRPVFEMVTVDVYPWARDRRYRQDVANCYPSFKAALDGAVDAGLITSDDDRYLSSVTFHPHQFGRDALVLVFHEVG